MVSLVRTDSGVSGGSIESFDSDDMTEETLTYSYAPRDIFGDAAGLGEVIVAKTGEALPKDTKYMSRKGGSVGVKFRVNPDLSVEILKIQSFNRKKRSDASGSSQAPTTSTPKKKIRAEPVFDVSGSNEDENTETLQESGINSSQDKIIDESVNNSGLEKVGDNDSRVSLKQSKQEWLTKLKQKFIETVIQGLESSKRNRTKKSIEDGVKLSPKENKAVIAAINHEIFKFNGPQRPDIKLCRDVAGLLKQYIPDTYGCEEVLKTEEYGPLPMEKAKGEGGRSELATRIGDNFYNAYLRSCKRVNKDNRAKADTDKHVIFPSISNIKSVLKVKKVNLLRIVDHQLSPVELIRQISNAFQIQYYF